MRLTTRRRVENPTAGQHGGLLEIRDLSQSYGPVAALAEIDLAIAGGEFVTLLGPSGCGKTTLLRAIAGFLAVSSGRVLVDGADVTRTPPHRRPMNMVFQRPTLFPHLCVKENVAFGLRLKRLSGREVERQVSEALGLVRLESYGQRRTHELSGGQMQRVALARAIVNRPRVLLLDEPLSALDLKVRLEMESELRRVHRETGATFVYVTHDQREALALSDRIVVFQAGRIQQVGTPEDVYYRPASAYVAGFVGDANVIPVTVESDGSVHLGGVAVAHSNGHPPGPAWLVVKQESVELAAEAPAPAPGTPGQVIDIAFRGSQRSYQVRLDGVERPIKAEGGLAAGLRLDVGARVNVAWEPASALVLPR